MSKKSASYVGFDFTKDWRIYEDNTNPLLRSLLIPVTVTANNASKTYDGLTYSGGFSYTTSKPSEPLSGSASYSGTATSAVNASATPYSIKIDGLFSDKYDISYGGTSQGAINAGTYAITLSGLSAQNYTISYVNGSLVINPKQLAVSIIGTPTKVYEGNASAKLTSANYSISGYVGTDKVTINQTYGSYNSQHVSLANSVSANLGAANIVAGAGTIGSNYLLPTLAFGAGRITPATLTYLADLRTLSFGSSIPLLTGNVIGFMEGDNLKNATTGTAVWKTAATSKSLPGKYAINGSGLTSNYGDYKFIQAASNATALTIYCPTKTCR